MSVNNQTVSKQKLHAFFNALEQYGIEMQWGVEPAGDYYNDAYDVGSFVYKKENYLVETIRDGDNRSGTYITLKVTLNGKTLVETLNFDAQMENFQRRLFEELGIMSNSR